MLGCPVDEGVGVTGHRHGRRRFDVAEDVVHDRPELGGHGSQDRLELAVILGDEEDLRRIDGNHAAVVQRAQGVRRLGKGRHDAGHLVAQGLAVRSRFHRQGKGEMALYGVTHRAGHGRSFADWHRELFACSGSPVVPGGLGEFGIRSSLITSPGGDPAE
jgi:hypothetical protein